MPETVKTTLFKIKNPKVAVLVAEGYSTKDLNIILDLIIENGAKPVIVTPKMGLVRSLEGNFIRSDRSVPIVKARDFDAIFVPDGAESAKNLIVDCLVIDFINEAFLHHRVIGASGSGAKVVSESHLGRMPVFADIHENKIICGNGLAVASNGTAIDVGMDFLYEIAERLDMYDAEYTEASA